jgi:CheY-like chemotaxis protein
MLTTMPDMPLRNTSILVVEDEFLIALELQTVLEEAGASVTGPASTIEQALPLVSPTLSCALLDLRLGDVFVTPVAKKLEGHGVPFAFYSGQLPKEPMGWPDIPRLHKPCSPTTIIRTVANLISSAAVHP